MTLAHGIPSTEALFGYQIIWYCFNGTMHWYIRSNTLSENGVRLWICGGIKRAWCRTMRNYTSTPWKQVALQVSLKWSICWAFPFLISLCTSLTLIFFSFCPPQDLKWNNPYSLNTVYVLNQFQNDIITKYHFLVQPAYTVYTIVAL